ncbi:hypothetical protein V3C99_005521 [Haemonchus contortus]
MTGRDQEIAEIEVTVEDAEDRRKCRMHTGTADTEAMRDKGERKEQEEKGSVNEASTGILIKKSEITPALEETNNCEFQDGECNERGSAVTNTAIQQVLNEQ